MSCSTTHDLDACTVGWRHQWGVWGLHLTKGQPDPKADQMSHWPEVIPLLTTRCLYQGVGADRGLPLTKGQADPKADQMSCWPEVAPLLTTRCLYEGVHLKTKDSLLQTENILLKTHDGLLNTADNTTWAQVNQTYLVPLLATRWLYWGMSDGRSAQPNGWQHVKLFWHSTILGHQISQRGYVWTQVMQT